jgi:GNAT superfamily N-acetyltransferase
VRPGIEVRPVQPPDMHDLVGLCLTARRESWAGPQVCTADAETIGRQIGAFTGIPGATIHLALSEHAVVGMLLGRTIEPNLFTDQSSFAVEAVYVDPRHRRRGAGHALMLAATESALESGAEQIFAAPIPGARGMQRFFVRLGFVPAAAHRVISTSVLHRNLTTDGGRRRSGPRGLDDLIARRRQSRAEDPEADQAARGSISKQVNRAEQRRLEAESTTTIS